MITASDSFFDVRTGTGKVVVEYAGNGEDVAVWVDENESSSVDDESGEGLMLSLIKTWYKLVFLLQCSIPVLIKRRYQKVSLNLVQHSVYLIP